MKQNWTVVGRSDQVCKPGDYFADELMGEPFVVVRDNEGKLRAFYNVCRHHAAQLKPSCSSGQKDFFVVNPALILEYIMG